MLKVKLYSRANRERDVKMFYEALYKVIFLQSLKVLLSVFLR